MRGTDGAVVDVRLLEGLLAVVESSATPSGPISISNEFTSIEVRKVTTRNGELLEIRSRKLGFVIRLDPLELESLTWQHPEHFSQLLETPYGPEENTRVRALTELVDLARNDKDPDD